MPVVLSHTTALQLLRVWNDIPHAFYTPLCPEFSAGRADSDGKSPSRNAPLEGAANSPTLLEQPTARQARALLAVTHPRGGFTAVLPGELYGTTGPSDREALSPYTPASSPSTRHPLFKAPLDVLAPCPSARSGSSLIRSHVWRRPLPTDCMSPVQPGLYTSGPELCYLQLAETIDPVRLALLGCELTGSYSLDPLSPFGVVQRAPLTSLDKLRATIDRFGSARGTLRARNGLATILPGAASPMEARIGLYFSLPALLGGHHMEAPALNMRFDVTGSARRVTNQSYFRGDLCWASARVAVEYDSDAAHTGSDRIAHDAKRRNALTALGVMVIVVTREQAQDYNELNRVAYIVQRLLGKVPRERRLDQDARRRRLHAMLFGSNSTNREREL